MKIVQATIRYYPALGGVEEYVQRLSEGLTARGNEVCVFTSDLARHTGGLRKLKNAPGIVGGVRVRRAYTLPWMLRDYSLMPGLPGGLLREPADLVHGHCFMSFPMDAACLGARMKKVPFVFSPYFTQRSRPSLPGRLYRKTLGAAAMQADCVVVISEFERKMIHQAGYRPKRFALIPPGIDVDKFKGVRHNIYERYGIAGRRVILFVGRLDANKGVDILLRAAGTLVKRFPDCMFVIAGDDFGARASLESLTQNLSLEDHVLFTGRLGKEDILSAFKHASVFAFPSLYEAFGIVLIEAMAAGTAVVASDSSAIPYVVDEGRTGLLFPSGDARALAERIALVLGDGRLRASLVEAASRSVLAGYD
ncbi:MAG: glycosyltransferase family 4 protein, partial [Candidatus Omnitrophica bacterium]|nr:glycosyltransferase family 4 protein [Candidatus Omnitrophota bacterium]